MSNTSGYKLMNGAAQHELKMPASPIFTLLLMVMNTYIYSIQHVKRQGLLG
jgi:hypothetical protein